MNARKKDAEQKKDKIDIYEEMQVRYVAESFERSLVTELRETNTYFVSPVDEKLFAALRQVKDLHRNPAIHFETLLTMGQALTLVGMIHGAISTTLEVVSRSYRTFSHQKPKSQKYPNRPSDAAYESRAFCDRSSTLIHASVSQHAELKRLAPSGA